MKNGELILRNAIAICENVQDPWQMVKHRDSENRPKFQESLLGAMAEYYPISARDQSRLHQVGANRWGEFGKEILLLQN